jgi:hypothetical protein
MTSGTRIMLRELAGVEGTAAVPTSIRETGKMRKPTNLSLPVEEVLSAELTAPAGTRVNPAKRRSRRWVAMRWGRRQDLRREAREGRTNGDLREKKKRITNSSREENETKEISGLIQRREITGLNEKRGNIVDIGMKGVHPIGVVEEDEVWGLRLDAELATESNTFDLPLKKEGRLGSKQIEDRLIMLVTMLTGIILKWIRAETGTGLTTLDRAEFRVTMATLQRAKVNRNDTHHWGLPEVRDSIVEVDKVTRISTRSFLKIREAADPAEINTNSAVKLSRTPETADRRLTHRSCQQRRLPLSEVQFPPRQRAHLLTSIPPAGFWTTAPLRLFLTLLFPSRCPSLWSGFLLLRPWPWSRHHISTRFSRMLQARQLLFPLRIRFSLQLPLRVRGTLKFVEVSHIFIHRLMLH